MNREEIRDILLRVKKNKLSSEDALDLLRDLPFKDLSFVKIDNHRELRRGVGEVIYCRSKKRKQLEIICRELVSYKRVLYTKVGKKKRELLLSIDDKLSYNKLAKMVFKTDILANKDDKNKIVILAAGTSDIPIAEEAYCTATFLGNNVEKYYDIGVAGIHRLFAIYDKIKSSSVIVAIAGMEGALPSVISGLVDCPVIAVPTSVGYGANFGGISALLTMINSCSPGIAVVNIDNGFGAGYLASQINKKNIGEEYE